MTQTIQYNGQIPTDPNNIFTALLTCAFLAAVLPPEPTQNLIALIPLALQLLPDRR